MGISQTSVNQFWDSCLDPPFRGPVGGLLHQQSLAATNLIDSKEPAGLRILGAASRRQLEDLFYAGSFTSRERRNRDGRTSVRRGSGPGRSNVFRGLGIEQLIVVPFHRAPDDIAAIAVFDAVANARELQAATDDPVIFKSVESTRGHQVEAGLALLGPVCLHASPRFGKDLFVFLDLIAAVQMQLRWTLTNPNFLPIVIAKDNERFRTCEAWQHLPKQRNVVLIAQTLDGAVLRQARQTNARIFIDPQLARTAATTLLPAGLLTRASQQARPWRDVLRSELLRRTPDEAAILIEQLELPRDELDEFTNRSKPQLIKHLRRSAKAILFTPTIRIKEDAVVEHAGSWWIDRTGERICSAIRIQEVLIKQDGTRMLRGTIATPEKPCEFTVSQQQAELYGLLTCLRRENFDHPLVDLSCKHGWRHRPLEIANKFHRPLVFTNADVVGWNGAFFSFPRFGLNWSGVGEYLRTPLVDHNGPGWSLTAPNPLVPRQLRELTRDQLSANRFWAVVTVMAYDALAAMLELPPIGVLCLGSDAERLSRTIAAVFGCRQIDTPMRAHARAAYQDVNHHLKTARWPVVLNTVVKSSTAMRNVLSQVSRENCFLASQDILWLPTALGLGWHVIVAEQVDQTIELLERFGQPVLLSYLRSGFQRWFGWHRKTQPPLAHIRIDIANFFGTLARGRPAVLGADQALWIPPHLRSGLVTSEQAEPPEIALADIETSVASAPIEPVGSLICG